jgi:hypothetical protein
MEIVLNNDDISKLIKDAYDGITEVKFGNKAVKVTLIVDFPNFSRKLGKAVATGAMIGLDKVNTMSPQDNLSQEERVELARKKGLMAPGGEDRVMLNIG